MARGEDLLSATPRQMLLHDTVLADGLLDGILADNRYPARPAGAAAPSFAHLPLLVGSDRKPLSKRHGSVAVEEFRRQGFLPEVLVNFLALCGWSYDATTEQMTVDELVERFSFERVGRNPSYFDTAKLRAMNGDRIKQLSDAELAELVQPHVAATGVVGDVMTPEQQALLLGLAPLLRERIQTLEEALPLINFCFRDDVEFDERAVGKHLKGAAADVLAAAGERLAALEVWDAGSILAMFDAIAADQSLGRGKVMQPVRVAVAGTAVSPPLPETLALLDRNLVVARIRAARPMVTA